MNHLKPHSLGHLKPPPLPPFSTIPSTTKSCNQLINNLSVTGSHCDVLFTYTYMLNTNTSSDAYTYPSLLKACTALGLMSCGILVHQHSIVNGYASDAYISSSLVHMYSKSGDINRARLVFDGMLERNVVPWSAIIGCYSRMGDVNMAFCMYNGMRKEGIQPNSVTILSLLAGISDVNHLKCLQGCVVRYGFGSDIVMMNSVLNVYGKCGEVDVAMEVFKSMDYKDIVSWNSLASSYSHNGYVRESIELLTTMRMEGVKPDHQTFGSVISAVASESRLGLGKLVHGQILTTGFHLDVYVETNLISMYLKCGKIDDAFRLFDQVIDRDVVSWTTMISGLLQNDRADESLYIFQRMLKSGIVPSTTTLSSALAACAQLGSFKRGTCIHGYVLRQRMKVDTAFENSLITMYAKCGYLEQSWAVFDRTHVKDVVSWNAMVAGYAQNGYLDEALVLFEEMRAAHERPDFITIVSLLQACASLGALHQGKWIHNFLIRHGVGPCISIDTALIDMYSKCGNIDSAKKCFDKMPEKDLVTWSVIISGYGSHGKCQSALRMYNELLQSGIKPNHVVFLAVLAACSHAGLISQGLRIFNSMTEEFGIEPKLEHRACIVDLLSRAGRLEEAYEFFKRMFHQPNIDVLGILLDACRAYRNADLADVVSREIIAMKPESAGNYVQLAHSYASMRRWDDVVEARLQMRSLGLTKVPGWSSIELHGVISTFFIDHTSHPRHDEIMLMLKVLETGMQDLKRDLLDYGQINTLKILKLKQIVTKE